MIRQRARLLSSTCRQLSTSATSRVYLSNTLVPTLRDAPADAATEGHKYLLRSGLIRKSHQGGFVLMPLGLRVYDKIVSMIDDAMSTVPAAKLTLPTMLPADIWKKSGRWESTGPELIKLKDRHGHDFCLAPTHEELPSHPNPSPTFYM